MERQDLDTFRTSFKKPFLVRSAMNERTGAARPLSLPALAVVGVEPGASFAGERIAGPFVTQPVTIPAGRYVFPDRDVIIAPRVDPRIPDLKATGGAAEGSSKPEMFIQFYGEREGEGS